MYINSFVSDKTIEKSLEDIYKNFISLYTDFIKPNLENENFYSRNTVEYTTVEEAMTIKKNFSSKVTIKKILYFPLTKIRLLLINDPERETSYTYVTSFTSDPINKTCSNVYSLIFNNKENNKFDISSFAYRAFICNFVPGIINFMITERHKINFDEIVPRKRLSATDSYLVYVYLRTIYRIIICLTDETFDFENFKSFALNKTDNENVCSLCKRIWDISYNYSMKEMNADYSESDNELNDICLAIHDLNAYDRALIMSIC